MCENVSNLLNQKRFYDTIKYRCITHLLDSIIKMFAIQKFIQINFHVHVEYFSKKRSITKEVHTCS